MNVVEYRNKWLNSGMAYVGPAVEKTIIIDGVAHSALDESLTNGELRQFGILYIRSLKNAKCETVIQTFLVKNFGTPEEEVLPIARELENEPEETHTFRDLVRTYLDANHISPARPKITIDSVNEIDEFAIVTAYEVADNTISQKRYFLYRDSNGAPVFLEYIG